MPSVDKLQEAYEVNSSSFYFVKQLYLLKLVVAWFSFFFSFVTKLGFIFEVRTRWVAHNLIKTKQIKVKTLYLQILHGITFILYLTKYLN